MRLTKTMSAKYTVIPMNYRNSDTLCGFRVSIFSTMMWSTIQRFNQLSPKVQTQIAVCKFFHIWEKFSHYWVFFYAITLSHYANPCKILKLYQKYFLKFRRHWHNSCVNYSKIKDHHKPETIVCYAMFPSA